MRHRKKKVTLDRKHDQRGYMLPQFDRQCLIYEKVKTTEVKAKVIRTR
jgi:ribosomal protein L17